MLNSGKKINILTLVLPEKKISERKKTHSPSPPLQVKWSVPNTYTCMPIPLPGM